MIELTGKVKYYSPSDKWSLENINLSEFYTNNFLDAIDECLRNIDENTLQIGDRVTIIVERELD